MVILYIPKVHLSSAEMHFGKIFFLGGGADVLLAIFGSLQTQRHKADKFPSRNQYEPGKFVEMEERRCAESGHHCKNSRNVGRSNSVFARGITRYKKSPYAGRTQRRGDVYCGACQRFASGEAQAGGVVSVGASAERKGVRKVMNFSLLSFVNSS